MKKRQTFLKATRTVMTATALSLAIISLGAVGADSIHLSGTKSGLGVVAEPLDDGRLSAVHGRGVEMDKPAIGEGLAVILWDEGGSAKPRQSAMFNSNTGGSNAQNSRIITGR